MTVHTLPHINLCLNCLSSVLLLLGYYAIKQGNRQLHKRLMLLAVTSSSFFLISYSIYHFQVGSVAYPLYDWTRTVYFTILIPHVILAAVICPFVIVLLIFAFRNSAKHKRLAIWVWPTWLFVSVSGVLIYLMLYCLASAK